MRKMLIAAVGIALIFGLQPAATGESGEPAKAQLVKRFKLHTHTNHAFGPRNYVGTDVLRRDGKFIGYDSYSGYSNPQTKSVFRFALALKGGMIFGRVVQRAAHPDPTVGPILGGSGKFAGIEGTAQIRFTTPQTLILRYRL
jgi:hypothetical protein